VREPDEKIELPTDHVETASGDWLPEYTVEAAAVEINLSKDEHDEPQEKQQQSDQLIDSLDPSTTAAGPSVAEKEASRQPSMQFVTRSCF